MPDFCVRNTFIDSAPERRPSLEEFLPRSRCLSAPTQTVGLRMRRHSTIDPVPEENVLDSAALSGCNMLVATPGNHGASDADACSVPVQDPQCSVVSSGCWMSSSSMTCFDGKFADVAEASVSSTSSEQERPAQQYYNPQFSSQWFPIPVDVSLALEYSVASCDVTSLGSVGHETGSCKPCAWHHSARGCQNGTQCQFCHACAPGELKRRKRERAMFLAAQNSRCNVTPNEEP